MKHRWAWVSIALVVMVLVATMAATATTYSNWSGKYRVGETVLFKVDTEQFWWWGCCCCCCNQQPACPAVQISGWHVADSTGKTIYQVVFDTPVDASGWQGSWGQVDSSNAAVPAGYYTLYVDTTVGTLSRHIQIYDPCNCCWSWSWNCNTCTEVASITNCGCRTSLVLLKEVATNNCCVPLFWWPCCPNH
ncbi:MAG TPA: hypothetical protein ENF29_04645 [Candidatus Acetothermia bacterium]|nr:hypothetical protein [Candidatus Acetothermia bacterium]